MSDAASHPAVLHLVSPATCGDEAVMMCAAVMRSCPTVRQRVVILGSRGQARRARSMGLAVEEHLGVSDGRPQAAWRSVARVLGAWAKAGRPFHLVHAWCGATLRAARLAAPGTPRVATFAWAPSIEAHGSAWSEPLGALRGALFPASPHEALAVFNDDDRPAVERFNDACGTSRGVRFDVASARVRRLDVPRALAPLPPRGVSRAELGLSPEDRAVLLVSAEPSRADGLGFAFATGLIYLLGHRVVGLMTRDTADVRRAARFVRLHGRRWGVVVSDAPVATLLAASDAVVFDPGKEDSTPGPVLCHLAHAAGVRIVTPLAEGDAGRRAGLHPVCLPVVRKSSAIAAGVATALAEPMPTALRAPGGDHHDVAGGAGHDIPALWAEMLGRATTPRPLPVPAIATHSPMVQPA